MIIDEESSSQSMKSVQNSASLEDNRVDEKVQVVSNPESEAL